MPIKFRCQHCRQLLGISRSKAGTAVDCPKCGRLVLVPAGEEQANAVPQPKLNLRDPALAQALDELASIGKKTHDRSDSVELPVIELASAPAPEPVPSPAPVVTQAPTPAAPSRKAPKKPAESPPASTDPASGVSSGMVAGALASLAKAGPAAKGSAAGMPVTQPKRAWILVLISTLCVAGVLAALWIGHELGQRGVVVNPDREPSHQIIIEPPALPDRAPHDGLPAEPPLAQPALAGRITYINQSGASQPDRGARVIVLPMQREGTARLPVAGFRPGDSGADFKLASVAVRVLGGDLAVAADDGSFGITLPGAGEYQLLVLSHYQANEPGQPPGALRGLLESYFERPDQLLGRFAWQAARIRYKGTGTELWDYSFPKP